MRRLSGLDFLELVIAGIFFGVIALATFGVYFLAQHLFPGESQSMIRLGGLFLGLALGIYIAGWVVFRDLGPTFSKMILMPFFAPKIQIVVPKQFVGFVHVIFGDALGVMEKDPGFGCYVVRVGADGKATVPCPPRLAFFWDFMLGARVSEDSNAGITKAQMIYPWHHGFGKGRAGFKGLNACCLSLYYDTPEHLAEIKSGKREAPERSYSVETEMIDKYYERFGVKRREL